jgi:hypothetical protein
VKDSGERRLDRLIIAGTLVVLVGLVVAALAIVDAGLFDDKPPACAEYEFDVDGWQDESSRTDEAETLARCEVLVGRDRSEVVSMLKGGDSFYPKRTDRYRLYFLYADFDTTYFTVEFNESDRVERTYIATH